MIAIGGFVSRIHEETRWMRPLLAVGDPAEKSSGFDIRGRRGVVFSAEDPSMPVKTDAESPSELIDARIEDLGDWRGETLARVRALIVQADPDVVEAVKWTKPSNSMLGVPVWSHDGIICTGETYGDKVKLTFARGAALADPAGLFNAGLDGNVRRAIDIHEGADIDEQAFDSLVREAVALNAAAAGPPRRVQGR
jgi:hypothetical protein